MELVILVIIGIVIMILVNKVREKNSKSVSGPGGLIMPIEVEDPSKGGSSGGSTPKGGTSAATAGGVKIGMISGVQEKDKKPTLYSYAAPGRGTWVCKVCETENPGSSSQCCVCHTRR